MSRPKKYNAEQLYQDLKEVMLTHRVPIGRACTIYGMSKHTLYYTYPMVARRLLVFSSMFSKGWGIYNRTGQPYEMQIGDRVEIYYKGFNKI